MRSPLAVSPGWTLGRVSQAQKGGPQKTEQELVRAEQGK